LIEFIHIPKLFEYGTIVNDGNAEVEGIQEECFERSESLMGQEETFVTAKIWHPNPRNKVAADIR
jgi:hypothetical protein